MKIKSEDIDYIYIDTSELKFRIVMNDDKGDDLVVHSDNIDLSNLAIDDLCDDYINSIKNIYDKNIYFKSSSLNKKGRQEILSYIKKISS